MGPILSGLFVGASFLTSIYSNKRQAKIESAAINLQTEQAKLQASEASLERTKAFRQNMSQNLALSGMGFGSTTALATAAAEGFGNYMADIGSINTGVKFSEASGSAKKALSKANKFSRNIGATESAATLAMKLGLFV